MTMFQDRYGRYLESVSADATGMTNPLGRPILCFFLVFCTLSLGVGCRMNVRLALNSIISTPLTGFYYGVCSPLIGPLRAIRVSLGLLVHRC
jgi:hypothetical protein